MTCRFAAAWMVPHSYEWNQGAPGKLSLSPWLINSEYSSIPFMSDQELQQEEHDLQQG